MNIVCPDGDLGCQEMLDEGRLKKLRETGTFTWYDGKPETTEELIERVGDAEGVLIMWDFPREAMVKCKNLKIICYTGTGAAKYIDLEMANKLGILVCNVPTYCENAVAEHTLALMLGIARKLTSLDQEVRQGHWPQPLVMELRGKVLGLLGIGCIGKKVASLANALGMKVVCWTKNPSTERAREAGVEFVSFTDVFQKADFVSIHLHHSKETEKIIGKRELNLMKPSSFLINTARGEIVDTDALIESLENEIIAGAGLDVFDDEPIPEGHIMTKLKNIILTPHVAYNTPEAAKKLFDISLDNFIQYKKGLPVNVINGPS